MKLFHGGTEIIDNPLINAGRTRLDFGPGFYLTQLYSQAESWAQRMGVERNAKPIVNIYELDTTEVYSQFRRKVFDDYNEDWLNYVCSCRANEDIYKKYDYVEGGVADDRVIDTVRLYQLGYIKIDDALSKLRYLKPNNQICILNQKIIDSCLKFKGYEIK